MRPSTLPSLCAALVLLVACGSGGSGAADENAANAVAGPANDDIEALPSDGLAVPEGATLDSESNAVGSASGGNAM